MKKLLFSIALATVLCSCEKKQEEITLTGKMIKIMHEYVTENNADADYDSVGEEWYIKDLKEYLLLGNSHLDAFLFVDADGDTLSSRYCSLSSVCSSVENGLVFTRERGRRTGNIGLVNLETDQMVRPLEFAGNSEWYSGVAIVVDTNGRYGVLNDKGEFVLSPGAYDVVLLSGNGYLVGQKGDQQNVLDINGEMMFCLNGYDGIRTDIGEGLFGLEKDGKWGLVDVSGKTLIPFEYDEFIIKADDTYGGLLCVKKDGKVGFFDKKGNAVIPCEYDSFNFLSNLSNAFVLEKAGKSGVIDFEGKIVWPFEFDAVFDACGDLLRGTKDGVTGVINRDGEWLSTEVDEFGLSVSKLYRNTLSIWKDGNVGLMNADGEQVVPCEYDYFSSEGSRLIMGFRPYGYYAFFNGNGEPVGMPGITEVLCGDFIRVSKDRKFGLYDYYDNLIIPIEYEYLFPMSYDDDEEEYLVHAMSEEKNDFYNLLSGKLTYSSSTSLDIFSEKYLANCIVYNTSDGSKTVFLDKNGNLVYEMDGVFIPKHTD